MLTNLSEFWLSLPGIGRTTAGSIISSAFNLPEPILDGNVKICNENKEITLLSRGHFVGEISYLTKDPAIADVVSDGEVSYIEWNNKLLNELKKNNKIFWIKIQNILLMDMIEKIKRSIN